MSGKALLKELESLEITLLAVTPYHAAAVGVLPSVHKDPFDRLLVAQAQCESMHLLTHDQTLATYGPHVIVI